MHSTMRRSGGVGTYNGMSFNPTHRMTHGTSNVPASRRRRSQRACDMCYQKKTKCDLDESSLVCVQCARRKSRCVLRGQKLEEEDRTSNQYVQALEERLERIELLLQAAGIVHESDLNQDDISGSEGEASPEEISETDSWHQQTPGRSPHQATDSSTSSGHGNDLSFPSGGDFEVTSIFKGHEKDDSRYYGQSCSLSILSRDGIEWIKNKSGDTEFTKFVKGLAPDSVHDTPWSQWRPDVFHDLFASEVYKPLPPRSEVFSLIKDFFRTANRLFPIYDKSSFMKMVEWQYTQQTCDDAARWASINMAICLGYEFRISVSLKPEKDREKARLYFRNAMSVFTELAIRRTDLLSAQALLSMSAYLRGNMGTQSAVPFITAAMRTCQRMGLHRNIPRPDLTPVEQEQRRRVFWVAFVIDQSTCMRAGNAPCQHPDDFDIPLPQEMDHDHDPDNLSRITFFRRLCRISLIKTRIYCRLYSAKSLLKPPREIYQTVQELQAELDEWKRDYPLSTDWTAPKQKVAESDFPIGFAALSLNFVYHNALIMIHRIPMLLNLLIMSREEPDDLKSYSKAYASESAVICVEAARDTMKIVNNMPWGDVAWVWSMLYYVFLAAATIFSNILRDARNPQVSQDLQYLNMVAEFFAALKSREGPSSYAGCMARTSANLELIARMVVNKEEKRRDRVEEEEYHLTSSKRRNSRAASASFLKSRLRPARPGNFLSDYASDSHGTMSAQPKSLNTSHIHTLDPSIPEFIEGLPPINSYGYVVPMSPDDRKYLTSTVDESQIFATTGNSYAGLGVHNIDEGTDTNFETPNMANWQVSQNLTAVTPSPLDSNHSFSSQYHVSAGAHDKIPESWQIPLTADWQFGDDLWAGLLPLETRADPGQSQESALPILSATSFLDVLPDSGAPNDDINADPGYAAQYMGYTFAPTPWQNQDQSQDSNGFRGFF